MIDQIACLAEPRRREILRILWTGDRGAGEIHQRAGGITFGAVSQHLAKMTTAGLVSVRREGRRRIYRIDRSRFDPHLRRWLETTWDMALDRLAELAETEATECDPRERGRTR